MTCCRTRMRAPAFTAAALLALLALAAGEPRAAAVDAASSDGSYGAIDSAATGAQPRDAGAAAARSIDAPTMTASIGPETAPRNASLEELRIAVLPSGASCSVSDLLAGGWRNRVTVSSTAGGVRSFLLVLPRGFSTGPPLPLLLALHGGAAYATNFLDFSYLDSRGIAAGFAVAAPDGMPGTLRVGGVWRLQNAAGDGSGDVHPDVDDVAFVADVAGCIAALGVPLSDRLALAGFSMGAKFATRVACSPPPGFADVTVAVAAGLQEPRPTCRSVPLLLFQGSADPQVPFCTRAAQLGPMAYWPTRLHFEAWLLSNDADDAAVAAQRCSLLGDSVLYRYPPRAGGAPTKLLWSVGGSHVWPGALAGCSGDGTDVALSFLKDPAQPLPCNGLAACARDPPCGAAWTGASMR